jgi:hypothetical protein
VYSAAYITEEAEEGQDIPQQLMYTHTLLDALYRNSQQDAAVYQNLLFHVHIKLNMFRAACRPKHVELYMNME